MKPVTRPNYMRMPRWAQPWSESFQKKVQPWLQRHKRALSWGTTLLALAAMTHVLASHGGWASLSHVHVVHPGWLACTVALVPLNFALEVAKWRRLKLVHLAHTPKHLHTWRASWHEVLKGQAWSVLGPSRVVDGVGRVAHMGSPEHAKEAAKAFGVGGLSQGMVTYAMGVPALWMLGQPSWSLALGTTVVAALVWTGSRRSWREALAWSASRYAVFASQYLACLVAMGALALQDAWSEGFPRIAGVWCVTTSVPWPTELGLRELAATWAFDDDIPAVVAATFVVWLCNRAVPATLGLLIPRAHGG